MPAEGSTFGILDRRSSRVSSLIDKVRQDAVDTASQREKPQHNKRGRVRDALVSVGNMDLYYRWQKCHFGPTPSKIFTVCGSPYCAGCRNRLAISAQQRIMKRLEHGRWREVISHVTNPLLIDEVETTFSRSNFTNEDLLHITGLVEICLPRESDVQDALKRDKDRWRRIRRRLNRITDEVYWIECTYEYEMIQWRFLQHAEGSDYKKSQIQQLIDHYGDSFADEPFLLIHFHGLTNLPRSKIQEVFYTEYFCGDAPILKTDKKTGLYIQSLHANKTLEENIRKIASYPFKDAYRFKHSFVGKDFTNGEYLSNEELGRLVSIYDKVQGRGMRTLFRSLSNEIDLWNEVEKHLIYLLNESKKTSFKNSKSAKGKTAYHIVQTLARILTKLRNQKGNISTKHLTSVITDMMLKEKVIADRRLNWKISEIFPKPKRGKYRNTIRPLRRTNTLINVDDVDMPDDDVEVIANTVG
jgi:hypothetical protein